MAQNKNCQSCGMPMKKSPGGGGTEANGSLSLKYCSYCYSEGKFTQPDWTVEDMQKLLSEKMSEMGFPKFTHGFFLKRVPKLERWKQ